MHILEEKIRAACAQGRTALIPFVTAGFPSLNSFWGVMQDLDTNGADIIEVGVPFSDPVADGPVVEAASMRALEQGVTLRGILEGLKNRHYKAGIVLMGYMNPFLQYGLETFAKDAAAAGVHGCIVPDLPLEEDAPFRTVLAREGIALIPLVGPNTPQERMARYDAVGQGYVYVVSIMGVTGERQGLPPQARETLARAKKIFRLPVALGFGLREPAQLEGLGPDEHPDAAVFGSALLKHLEAGGDAASFLSRWR